MKEGFCAECPQCKHYGLDVVAWEYKGNKELWVIKCPKCHEELVWNTNDVWAEEKNGITCFNVESIMRLKNNQKKKE